MKTCLLFLILTTSVLTAAAQPISKRDILGFYPGMDNKEFEANGAKNNLYCHFWKFEDNLKFSYPDNDAEGNYCFLGHAGNQNSEPADFVFYNTQYLSPNVLWKIEYHFVSGKSRADLISEISTRFNVQPVSKQLEPPKTSGNAVEDALRQFQGSPITTCLVGVGTEDPIFPSFLVGLWNLDKSTPLVLSQGAGTTEQGIIVPGWNLMLCDQQILADERKIYQQKQHTLGPPTRF